MSPGFMPGTMQDGQLGVARLLRQALAFGAVAPVFTMRRDAIVRTSLHNLAQRALRLGAGLAAQGVGPGQAVATFCATTPEHLESYLGVPARGMVLHALNIRMADEDIADILRRTGDVALVLDQALLDRFASIEPLLGDSAIRLVLVTSEGPLPHFATLRARVQDYEAFIAGAPDEAGALPEDPPERAAAAICHTGGTTGRPKAVAYSHRAIWLQATSLCTANSLALSRDDTALLAVPLYHVNGWGLPYAAVLAGSGLVLPGASFAAPVLERLLEGCGTTIAAGVPTIWMDLLKHRAAAGARGLGALRRLATGGAVVPQRLVDSFAAQGIEVIQAWGMTETCSMSVIGRASLAAGAEDEHPIGYPVAGIELRAVAEDGQVLPLGDSRTGELQVSGPCVIDRYLDTDTPDNFDGVWLKTGDIGRIDGAGRVTLTDRLKDAIKSGGEWIAAPLLEDALRTVPGIADVAVIARPHPRWQERPLAVIVRDPAAPFDPLALRGTLPGRLPAWWIPDAWAEVDALPVTGLGKPDKAALRRQLAAGALDPQEISTPETKPKNGKETP